MRSSGAQSYPMRGFAAWNLQMRQSTVVGAGGKSVTDTIRTSRGTFLRCSAAEALVSPPSFPQIKRRRRQATPTLQAL